MSSRKPVENEDRVFMGDDFHLRNGSGQVEFLLSNGISFGRHNVIVVSVTEGKTISDVKMGVFKWKQL